MFLSFLFNCTEPFNQIIDDRTPGGIITPNLASKRLPQFGSSLIAGYGYVDELIEDLDIVAYSVAESIIESDQDYYPYLGWGLEVGAGTEDLNAGNASGYETNVQVTGVDEADIVKSDGRFLFIVAGGELVVIDKNAELDEDRITDRLTLFADRGISDILLSDGTIIAISGDWGWYWIDSGWTGGTEIALVNVDSGGELSILDTEILGGVYIDARLSGDIVHIFTNTYLDYYPFAGEIVPYHSDFDGMDRATYKKTAYAKLVSLIPRWRNNILETIFSAGGSLDEEMVRNTVRLFSLASSDEENPSLLPFEVPFSSYTQITSFELSGGFSSLRKAGAFSTGWGYANIYASGETIVIANNGWEQADTWDWREVTYILAFANNLGTVSPVSAGKIEGYTLGQFSIDYYDGYLRVATTRNAGWGFDETSNTWEQISESESFVTVLDVSTKEMAVAGQVDNLGLGERIMAVRFIGDVAYVVTFRQIDPFYTIDVSNPSNPAVAGELKILGFSNYLHPMEDGWVLAVGQDASEIGTAEGLQIAVFNVTDPSNPVQQYKYVVEGNSYSSAQWDHHAFRYLPDTGLLVLPVEIWDYSGDVYLHESKFMLLSVSTNSEIASIGEISYPESFDYSYLIEPRSMVFGDEIVTMKNQYVIACTLNTQDELWRVRIDF